MTGLCFSGIRGGNARKSHGCDSQKLADQCHRVCSELSTAGAGSGACSTFKRSKLSVRHSAASVHADRFEDVLDGDGMALELTRRDRAAIQNKSGNIETRQGHHAAGYCFVAADENNQRIEEIPSCDELDRIRNDFTAD